MLEDMVGSFCVDLGGGMLGAVDPHLTNQRGSFLVDDNSLNAMMISLVMITAHTVVIFTLEYNHWASRQYHS